MDDTNAIDWGKKSSHNTLLCHSMKMYFNKIVTTYSYSNDNQIQVIYMFATFSGSNKAWFDNLI